VGLGLRLEPGAERRKLGLVMRPGGGSLGGGWTGATTTGTLWATIFTGDKNGIMPTGVRGGKALNEEKSLAVVTEAPSPAGRLS